MYIVQYRMFQKQLTCTTLWTYLCYVRKNISNLTRTIKKSDMVFYWYSLCHWRFASCCMFYAPSLSFRLSLSFSTYSQEWSRMTRDAYGEVTVLSSSCLSSQCPIQSRMPDGVFISPPSRPVHCLLPRRTRHKFCWHQSTSKGFIFLEGMRIVFVRCRKQSDDMAKSVVVKVRQWKIGENFIKI